MKGKHLDLVKEFLLENEIEEIIFGHALQMGQFAAWLESRPTPVRADVGCLCGNEDWFFDADCFVKCRNCKSLRRSTS